MENVVTVVFDVEADAYKAFSEIKEKPIGTDYNVVEGALIKRNGKGFDIIEAIDPDGVTSDDTSTGMLLGAFLGALGGPLGLLFGTFNGFLVGSVLDNADIASSLSMLEITAGKLYEGEAAIIVMVKEEEPAFDAAFAEYPVTIIRRTARAVIEEIKAVKDLEEDLAHQASARLRADRKSSILDSLAEAAEQFETETMAASEELTEIIKDAVKKPAAE